MRRSTALLLALVPLVPGCRLLSRPKPVPIERAKSSESARVVWRDLKTGSGEPARAGDQLTIEYEASLPDGTRVDATADRGYPCIFRLGMAPVRGWNEGLLGMQVGGKRHLQVPPELAYGHEGLPGLVPPDSSMHFDVELVRIDP